MRVDGNTIFRCVEYPMDRLDELTVFLVILDVGSLAGAARHLRRSPPAATRTPGEPGGEAFARLVERTTRALAPTEDGRRLAEQAQRLLADYAEAMRSAGSEQAPRGLLHVMAPVMFGQLHVAPVVTDFLAAHPAVRVDLMLSDRNLDLVEEGLDVAVRIGALADSGLVVRRVGEMRRVLVASPDYLAARGTPAAPAELARHDAVFTASRPRPLEWRFRGGAKEHVIRLSPRLVVSHVEAALAAALAGKGVTVALSYQVDAELRAVQLVVPSARHMPARVRLFLDHAVARLSRLEVIRPGAVERGWNAGLSRRPSAADASRFSRRRMRSRFWDRRCRIENNLGASEQRYGLAGDLTFHHRVPDLGRAPGMHQVRIAGHAALSCSADEIGFELGRREAGCAFRERHPATKAACGIRKRDDRRRVKISGWSEMMFSNVEPALHETLSRINPIESQETGQVSCLLGAKGRGCVAHASSSEGETFG